MSLDQAVRLVLDTAKLTRGGEVFILKMPSVNMANLANIFIKKHFPNQKIKVQLISNRPGDKTHEELFDLNDGQKLILENKDMFIIAPREKTNYYSVDPDTSIYKKFSLTTEKSFASLDNLNNKSIEKLV